MKRQGDGSDHGVDVQVQTAGKGVHIRQIAGPRRLGPVLECGLVRGGWREQAGEGADEDGETGHLGAGSSQLAEQRLLGVADGVRQYGHSGGLPAAPGSHPEDPVPVHSAGHPAQAAAQVTRSR